MHNSHIHKLFNSNDNTFSCMSVRFRTCCRQVRDAKVIKVLLCRASRVENEAPVIGGVLMNSCICSAISVPEINSGIRRVLPRPTWVTYGCDSCNRAKSASCSVSSCC